MPKKSTNQQLHKITEVTVYLQGAYITRSMSVALTSGKNIVSFCGLGQGIRQKTISVSTDNKAVDIFSAQLKENFISLSHDAEWLEKLKKELETIKNDITKVTSDLGLVETERKVLDTNMNLSGDNGLKIEDLNSAVIFFREQYAKISEKRLKLNAQLEKLNRDKLAIENQLKPTNQTQSSIDVETEVYSKSAQTVNFNLNYYTGAARWSPIYNLYAADTEIKLNYNAEIFQTTYEYWENVKLRLSTANPLLDNTPPIFTPEYMNIDRPTPRIRAAYAATPMMMDLRAEENVCREEVCESIEEQMPTIRNENVNTAVEYEISDPVDIMHEQKKSLAINSFTFDPDYSYFCYPSADTDSFKIATLRNYEKYNLLAASVNIYFDSKFIGNSVLNPTLDLDKLELSLGRDKNIVVKKTLPKDFSSTTIIGGNDKMTKEWTLSVKNNRAQAINLNLIERIPVSTNKALIIEILEISGAVFDKELGKLKWNLYLNPNESKILSVKYSILKKQ